MNPGFNALGRLTHSGWLYRALLKNKKKNATKIFVQTQVVWMLYISTAILDTKKHNRIVIIITE